MFRTPLSVDDAKQQIRKLDKGIKRHEAERADCERSQYAFGVKVQDQTLAELRAARAHFESWLKENA
jgi:hypothetical protein